MTKFCTPTHPWGPGTPGSSAVRNPPDGVRGLLENHQRITVFPMHGRNCRDCWWEHLKRKLMDECDAKVTDEDGSLDIMKELDQSCGQLDWVSAFASGHWRCVALERSPIYTSNSICVMSQMECGHPGGLEEFSGVIAVEKPTRSLSTMRCSRHCWTRFASLKRIRRISRCLIATDH